MNNIIFNLIIESVQLTELYLFVYLFTYLYIYEENRKRKIQK